MSDIESLRAINQADFDAAVEVALMLRLADMQPTPIPAPTATPTVGKLPPRYAAAAATYTANRAAGDLPYRLTDVITVNVPNPKRPGTAGYLRYSMWRTGMTVAEYLAALEASPHVASCRGYGPTDLTYNLKRGLISVSPAGAA